jgi:hypothetical protein
VIDEKSSTPGGAPRNGSGEGAAAQGGDPLGGLEVERLGAPGGGSTSPKMLVPLFVVPLLIVAVIVAIFLVVGRVVNHEKTTADLIQEIESGGVNERWQAAAHLGDIAVSEPEKLADPRLRARLRSVFQNAGPDDTRLRKFIARMWGRLHDVDAGPIILDAVARLDEMLKQPGARDGELFEKVSGELIVYLDSLGSLAIDPAEPVLIAAADDPDSGIRQASASALGEFGSKRKQAGKPPSAALVAALTQLHGDPDAWVRMNAALGLAKVDSATGLPTLEAMLDRAWLKERKLRFPDDGHYTVGQDDPAAVVITSALIAVDHLVDAGVIPHSSGPAPALRSALELATRDVHPGVQRRAQGLLTKLGG